MANLRPCREFGSGRGKGNGEGEEERGKQKGRTPAGPRIRRMLYNLRRFLPTALRGKSGGKRGGEVGRKREKVAPHFSGKEKWRS